MGSGEYIALVAVQVVRAVVAIVVGTLSTLSCRRPGSSSLGCQHHHHHHFSANISIPFRNALVVVVVGAVAAMRSPQAFSSAEERTLLASRWQANHHHPFFDLHLRHHHQHRC